MVYDTSYESLLVLSGYSLTLPTSSCESSMVTTFLIPLVPIISTEKLRIVPGYAITGSSPTFVNFIVGFGFCCILSSSLSHAMKKIAVRHSKIPKLYLNSFITDNFLLN